MPTGFFYTRLFGNRQHDYTPFTAEYVEFPVSKCLRSSPPSPKKVDLDFPSDFSNVCVSNAVDNDVMYRPT